ncbi:glycosyltransferase [Polynucleobacter sp. Tro8-14-1]|uniref:glycosyltransferase family 2 protein n=1 Tax=Polynucleobacter sp. Tro8-14-1 TaxID=1758383 RepID=UPI001C0AB900|nr:glycosyltransferase [Polynucleobacter sp. Tro8-14-1]MBU3563625.1 glycosyltransferase [Polynucleobacter sp. Tro8-14-1]
MTMFSIVVPVYNVEKYLYKCLSSISNQTIEDFEVILIDDGSTDLSLQICKNFCLKDSRFKVYTKKNEGQGIARNLGMSYAKGEYLSFIDSDDWIESNLYEVAYKTLIHNDIDFLSFGVDFVRADGVQIKKFTNYKFDTISGPEIFYRALIDDQILSIVWNKIFRRELLQSNNLIFPDIRAIEDIYFSRAVAQKSKKIVFVNEILYHALIRPNSSSRAMTIQSFLDAGCLLKMEYENFFRDGPNELELQYFSAHVLKFYTYLQIQSSFRVKSNSEYIDCFNIINNNIFYNKSLKLASMRKLPFKNRCMVLVCRSPFVLRIISKILNFFHITPY